VESVPAVLRSPPKAKCREAPTLSEGSTVPRAYCDTTDPEKLEAAWKCLTLKNKQKIRTFLGLCTYYRWFISSFANIVKPLTKFMEEQQAFQWTPEVEATFQTLKEALCAAPVLAYPQPRDRFTVDTNANNIRVGGVLSQIQNVLH
jgi:hypothetical protein